MRDRTQWIAMAVVLIAGIAVFVVGRWQPAPSIPMPDDSLVELTVEHEGICWGDMHGHTAISDGKGSLDDYFTHARDVAELEIVVVSDHDFGNAAPWAMPKEAWTLTQNKADQYAVNGKFVAIAGYEWTLQPKYWTPEEPLFKGPVKYYNHKNVYFASRVDFVPRVDHGLHELDTLGQHAALRVLPFVRQTYEPDSITDS